MDAAYCYLYLVEGEKLVVCATTKDFNQFLGWSLRRGEGLSGRVWQDGKSMTVEDYASWSGRKTAYDEWQFHAESAVPIWGDDVCVGVLGVARLGEDRRVFNSTEVENLTRFATLVSVVLDNVHLYLKAQNELAERRQSEERLQAILITHRLTFTSKVCRRDDTIDEPPNGAVVPCVARIAFRQNRL